MWKKHLALWVLAFGVFGYGLSWMVADKSWLTGEVPHLYQGVLLLKTVFFSSLKMLVAPIVFFSLLSGLLQMSEVTHLGSLGKVTLAYYMGTTAIAILIGLSVVFFVHPWENGPEDAVAGQPKISMESVAKPKKFIDKSEGSTLAIAKKMLSRVFVNPVKAFTDNNILGVVFWALLFGMGWLSLKPKDSPMAQMVNQIQDVLIRILEWIIVFAPLGVFAVAFDFQLKFSNHILSQLVYFCFVVFGATLIHGLIVLPLVLKFFAKEDIIPFFKKAAKPLMIAFGSSSSSATLPVSLETAEVDFGVSNTISGFVLPLGATMNMDGTALFEGIAAVFLAYVFGIDLSALGMISVFLMAVISSVGAPGMPSGSMSGMQMVLLAAGIPLEGIGLLLLVERPLDTFRTAVNVEGDLVGTLVVRRYFDE